MEKSKGRKSVSQARVENGMENPGLELMVIHYGGCCVARLLSQSLDPLTGLCMADLIFTCSCRKAEILNKDTHRRKWHRDTAWRMAWGIPLSGGKGGLDSSLVSNQEPGGGGHGKKVTERDRSYSFLDCLTHRHHQDHCMLLHKHVYFIELTERQPMT